MLSDNYQFFSQMMQNSQFYFFRWGKILYNSKVYLDKYSREVKKHKNRSNERNPALSGREITRIKTHLHQGSINTIGFS